VKVLLASQSFYPNIGGVSTYLLNLAQGLIERGHEVAEVHLRPPNVPSEEIVKGIPVFRVPREPLNRKLLAGYSRFKEQVYNESHGLMTCFTKDPVESDGYEEYNKINLDIGNQLESLLERNMPEIVHIHDFQLLLLYRHIPRGTPLFFTWHIPFVPKMSKYLKEFMIKHMNQFDKVIFSTKEYAKEAIKMGLVRDKVEVIYPITDTSMFTKMEVDPSRFRKDYGMKRNAKVILCVQRIDSKSGHEQLLMAMPGILKKFPGARLVFVGGKSLSNKISKDRLVYEQRVEALIRKLRLKSKVIFTGNIEYSELPKVYNSADVVALTSRLEGFGLSVTEAMACGTPVVGTSVGGIPEQIVHGRNGFLVRPGDYRRTADYIIKILSNSRLRQRMGEYAQKVVRRKFLKSITVEKHIKLYHDVLAEKSEQWSLRMMKVKDIEALITDFDRTLTDRPGMAEEKVINELKSIRKPLILSTGRPRKYIMTFFKKYPVWDAIVAENGAVVYLKQDKRLITCSNQFVSEAMFRVRKAGIKARLGDVIISVNVKDRKRLTEALKPLKKYFRFIYNVDEIMVLPKNVDKATGTKIALDSLKIAPEKTIIVGDAENDIELFKIPGFRVAVANAHIKLKMTADQVTKNPSSKGLIEVIEQLKL
jgi:phosphoglycolate phosphatase (TIGR01487 family)